MIGAVIRSKISLPQLNGSCIVNPYESSANTDTDTRRFSWALAWNAVVAVAIAGVLVLAAFIVNFHYSRLVGTENPRADGWLVFATASANDGMVLVGITLILMSISTFPFHRHAWATRSVAILACLLISLDFGLLQYRIAFEHADRAIMFAGFMFTMIVFGCGIPRSAGILWRKVSGRRVSSGGG